jgi:hypothetical protein
MIPPEGVSFELAVMIAVFTGTSGLLIHVFQKSNDQVSELLSNIEAVTLPLHPIKTRVCLLLRA